MGDLIAASSLQLLNPSKKTPDRIFDPGFLSFTPPVPFR
jgi:hypothetical protein